MMSYKLNYIDGNSKVYKSLEEMAKGEDVARGTVNKFRNGETCIMSEWCSSIERVHVADEVRSLDMVAKEKSVSIPKEPKMTLQKGVSSKPVQVNITGLDALAKKMPVLSKGPESNTNVFGGNEDFFVDEVPYEGVGVAASDAGFDEDAEYAASL